MLLCQCCQLLAELSGQPGGKIRPPLGKKHLKVNILAQYVSFKRVMTGAPFFRYCPNLSGWNGQKDWDRTCTETMQYTYIHLLTSKRNTVYCLRCRSHVLFQLIDLCNVVSDIISQDLTPRIANAHIHKLLRKSTIDLIADS
jgi:hypothetical protein